jgi:hypothetical protein
MEREEELRKLCPDLGREKHRMLYVEVCVRHSKNIGWSEGHGGAHTAWCRSRCTRTNGYAPTEQSSVRSSQYFMCVPRQPCTGSFMNPRVLAVRVRPIITNPPRRRRRASFGNFCRPYKGTLSHLPAGGSIAVTIIAAVAAAAAKALTSLSKYSAVVVVVVVVVDVVDVVLLACVPSGGRFSSGPPDNKLV